MSVETTAPPAPNAVTLCADCDQLIEWRSRQWNHLLASQPEPHAATPELRLCVDAVCPSCGWPELGFQPDRGEFICSRCQHTTTERPGAQRTAPVERDLLTPAEVAAMFRVDPKTVTRWANAGKLASVRTLGGHRRFAAADVQAALAQAAS